MMMGAAPVSHEVTMQLLKVIMDELFPSSQYSQNNPTDPTKCADRSSIRYDGDEHRRFHVSRLAKDWDIRKFVLMWPVTKRSESLTPT